MSVYVKAEVVICDFKTLECLDVNFFFFSLDKIFVCLGFKSTLFSSGVPLSGEARQASSSHNQSSLDSCFFFVKSEVKKQIGRR